MATLSPACSAPSSRNTRSVSRLKTRCRPAWTGSSGTLNRCGGKSRVGGPNYSQRKRGKADDLPGVHRERSGGSEASGAEGSRTLLPGARGVATQNHVEPVERIYLGLQGTRSDPAIPSDGKIGKFSRSRHASGVTASGSSPARRGILLHTLGFVVQVRRLGKQRYAPVSVLLSQSVARRLGSWLLAERPLAKSQSPSPRSSRVSRRGRVMVSRLSADARIIAVLHKEIDAIYHANSL